MKQGRGKLREPRDQGMLPTLDGSLEATMTAPVGSSAEDTAQTLGPGVTVGRFVLEKKLGEGGMGVVYLARDPTLQRAVAVKILRLGRAGSEGTQAHQRMLREAQALAMVNHPNLVTIYEVGTLGRDVFLAMEYVVGQTLDRWLEQSRSLEDVLEVFEQAGHALQAIHDAGLVHRDFKPANVLVTETGNAKLLDLGIASKTLVPAAERAESEAVSSFAPLSISKVRERPEPELITGWRPLQSGSAFDSQLTEEGALVGTPAYMSPEQVVGQAVVPASDQFTFGIALFEALTGTRPFVGSDHVQVFANIMLNERRSWPAESQIPPALRAVIDRTLAPTPEERFESMNAVLEACQHALGFRGQLRFLTARWVSRGRSADYLLPEGRLLTEGLQVLREQPEVLSKEATELLEASLFAAKKRRLKRRALLGGLGVLAVGLVPTGYLLDERGKQLQRAVRAELNAQLDGVSREVETIFTRAQENVSLLYAQRSAWLPFLEQLIVPGDPGYPELERRLSGPLARFNDFFRPIVELSSTVSSIQVARDDGVEVLVLDDPGAQKLVPAYRLYNRLVRRETFGESAFVQYWPARSKGVPESGWLFAGMLDRRGRAWMGYDPRKRNWYRRASARPAGAVTWTDPYLFFETKEPGMTASTSWQEGKHRYVLAVDFAVTDISRVTASLEHPRFLALVATQSGGIVGLPHSERFSSIAKIREFFVRFDDERRRAKLQGKPIDAAVELPTAQDIQIPRIARALAAGHGAEAATWPFEMGGTTHWAGSRPLGAGQQNLSIYLVERDSRL